jgi:voltage-gated potassium channel Kch
VTALQTHGGDHEPRWCVVVERRWLDQEELTTLTEQYVASVYWSFTTMTTVGYGDISAKTVAERVFAILGMLMGGFVLSAIISKLVRTSAM